MKQGLCIMLEPLGRTVFNRWVVGKDKAEELLNIVDKTWEGG